MNRPDPARPDRHAVQPLIVAERGGLKSWDLHENVGMVDKICVLAAGSGRTCDFVVIDELLKNIFRIFRNSRFLALLDTLYLRSKSTD